MAKDGGSPDLSGFPILRIDQLSIIDNETLGRSDSEARLLLESLSNEDDSGGHTQSMALYLHRQITAVQRELARRSASNRIDKILQEAIDQMSVTSQKNDRDFIMKSDSSDFVPAFGVSNSSNDSKLIQQPVSAPSFTAATLMAKASTDKPNPNFQPIPLPSELAASAGNKKNKPGLLGSEDQFTSRSQISDKHDDNDSHGSSTLFKPKTRRPRSGGDKPSLRSVHVIHENFGSTFVVGAVEKRKRFYPKKEPIMSAEELKEKERAERRNAALKRLTDRREITQSKHLERKKANLVRKANETSKNLKSLIGAPAKNSIIDAASSRPSVVSESDSDSVSGGDDDTPQLDVDKNLLEKFQKDLQVVVDMAKDLQQEELVDDKSHIVNESSATAASASVDNQSRSQLASNQNLSTTNKSVVTSSKATKSTNAKELKKGKGSPIRAHFGSDKSVNKGAIHSKNGISDSASDNISEIVVKGLENRPDKIGISPKVANATSISKAEQKVDRSEKKIDNESRTATAQTPDMPKTKKVVSETQFELSPSRLALKSSKPKLATNNKASHTKSVGNLPSDDIVAQNISIGSVSGSTERSEGNHSPRGNKSPRSANVSPRSKPTKKSPKLESNASIDLLVQGGNLGSPGPSDVDQNSLQSKTKSALDTIRRLKSEKASKAALVAQSSHGDFDIAGVAVSPGRSRISSAISKASSLPTFLLPDQTLDDDLDEIGVMASSSSPRDGTTDNSLRVQKISPRNKSPRVSESDSHGKRHTAKLVNTKSPLISLEDGVYMCTHGPDELPGLRAWILIPNVEVDVEGVTWRLNIEKYIEPAPFDHKIDQLRLNRSNLRRTIPFGLVRLAQDCSSILRGTVIAQSTEQLLAAWDSALKRFDDFANSYSVSNANSEGQMNNGSTASSSGKESSEELFAAVTVCGNCYAVCRKIENLLKTFFAVGRQNGQSQPHDTAQYKGSRSPKLERKVAAMNSSRKHADISDDLTSPRHIDMGGNEPVVPEPLPLGSLYGVVDAYSLGSGRIDERLVMKGISNIVKAAVECIDDNLDRASAPLYIDGTEFPTPAVNESDHLHQINDDDDESILPDYHHLPYPLPGEDDLLEEAVPLPQEVVPSYASPRQPPIGDDLASPRAVAPLTRREKQEMEERKDKMALAIQRNIKLTSPPKPFAGRLSEYYPHIGMIFPMAYSQMGNKPADIISAKALLESMQKQTQLYEEWMDVMSDYATVFSQERGIASSSTSGTGNATVYKGGSMALHYRVKAPRMEVTGIITDVFNNILSDWEELPAGLGLGLSWNLLWTWSKPRINMSHLLVWQRVNHFEDSKNLTRKDLLKKNLQRFTDMTGKIAEAFEIMPQTYILPNEYTQFVRAFGEWESRRVQEKIQNFWIMKPVGMSQGRGISLVRDIASLTYSQTSVVQKYIERPLCLYGFKFDLRLYVLVTSFKPLEAFIYREGFARVSTQTYSLDPSDMGNKFIHLTNSSIQKHNKEPMAKENPLMDRNSDVGGSKIALLGANGLWQRLGAAGIDTDVLWRNICLVVLKSLVVVDEKINHQPCCFEVFGYDIIIDSDLRPWLLEVNASPSMARENPLDVRVKNAMIRDTVLLVNPLPYDRAAVAKVLKRRLAELSRNKFIVKNDPDLESDLKSMLGPSAVPRRFGEEPKYVGDYQKLSPDTKLYEHVMRLKGKIIKPMP